MKLKILSARELMAEWGTQEELAIIEAINDGLKCYLKTYWSEPPQPIDASEVDGMKLSGQNFFDKLVFRRADVEKFEADHPEMKSDPLKSKATSILSVNAMLKQPVFKETMAALKEVLVYCEKNKPGKRNDAFDIMGDEKKYPHLTEQVYKAIWATIPADMKRKRGQRDH